MMNEVNLLIITVPIFQIPDEYRAQIKAASPEINITIVSSKDVTQAMISEAEIIFGWPTEEQISQAKNLRWLHLPSAGADGYTRREDYCIKEIRVTNSSGVYGLPIAEHIFAMILSYNRNMQEYAYLKTSKKWLRKWEVKDFYASTIGIIGLGDIGTEVAKRAKAWGATVLAVKRTLSVTPEYIDRIYPMEELEEVLKQSDYIVLALPNTPMTRGLITEQRLRMMKPEAFLVNIGRGVLIDQEALVKALSQGWIGGAGLDVTEPEPLPENNPLWELPNVILTSHTSGASPTNDSRRMNIFCRNLENYLANKPLENLLDFSEGY